MEWDGRDEEWRDMMESREVYMGKERQACSEGRGWKGGRMVEWSQEKGNRAYSEGGRVGGKGGRKGGRKGGGMVKGKG